METDLLFDRALEVYTAYSSTQEDFKDIEKWEEQVIWREKMEILQLIEDKD